MSDNFSHIVQTSILLELKQNKNNCWNYSCNRKHTLGPLGKGNLYILFACPQSLKIILWSFCIAIWEYCRCYICSFVYNAVNVTNVAVSIAAPIQVLTIDYMIKDILQIKGKYFQPDHYGARKQTIVMTENVSICDQFSQLLLRTLFLAQCFLETVTIKIA